MIFGGIGEIQQALDAKVVTLHSKVTCRHDDVDENGNP